MNRTTILLDRFNSAASLFNAIALVGHCRRNPDVLDELSEDQAGTVRNAQRMVDTVATQVGLIRIT